MRIDDVGPADQHQGPALLRLQRAAYAVEAAPIGDDRIPALARVSQRPSRRIVCDGWAPSRTRGSSVPSPGLRPPTTLISHASSSTRDGTAAAWAGRSCRQSSPGRGVRRVAVSTGRENHAARELYAQLGFIEVGDVEVIPRLWITRYSYIPSAL